MQDVFCSSPSLYVCSSSFMLPLRNASLSTFAGHMKVLCKFRCVADFATAHALVLECVCLLKLKACQGAS